MSQLSKQKKALLLLAYLDERNIFRFVLAKDSFHTLSFNFDIRFSVSSEIKSFIEKKLYLSPEDLSSIDVKENYREIFDPETKEDLRLYLAVIPCECSEKLGEEYGRFTFSELMKKLPTRQLRLMYLKVFQVLSDDKSHLIKAYETSKL